MTFNPGWPYQHPRSRHPGQHLVIPDHLDPIDREAIELADHPLGERSPAVVEERDYGPGLLARLRRLPTRASHTNERTVYASRTRGLEHARRIG